MRATKAAALVAAAATLAGCTGTWVGATKPDVTAAVQPMSDPAPGQTFEGAISRDGWDRTGNEQKFIRIVAKRGPKDATQTQFSTNVMNVAYATCYAGTEGRRLGDMVTSVRGGVGLDEKDALWFVALATRTLCPGTWRALRGGPAGQQFYARPDPVLLVSGETPAAGSSAPPRTP